MKWVEVIFVYTLAAVAGIGALACASIIYTWVVI